MNICAFVGVLNSPQSMFMIWTYGQPTAVLVSNTDSTKGTGSTRYQMTNGSLKATTVPDV